MDSREAPCEQTLFGELFVGGQALFVAGSGCNATFDVQLVWQSGSGAQMNVSQGLLFPLHQWSKLAIEVRAGNPPMAQLVVDGTAVPPSTGSGPGYPIDPITGDARDILLAAGAKTPHGTLDVGYDDVVLTNF